MDRAALVRCGPGLSAFGINAAGASVDAFACNMRWLRLACKCGRGGSRSERLVHIMNKSPAPFAAPVYPARPRRASSRPAASAAGASAGAESPALVLLQNSLAAPSAESNARAKWSAKYHSAKILRKQSDAKLSKQGKRVSHCGYIAHSSFVDLDRNAATGKAGFRGLTSCALLWVCPVCSARISAKRQAELNDLLQGSRAAGYSVLMLTQTFQHKRGDSLPVILAAFKDAQERFRQRRDWKALKAVIVGTVSALELTHGRNGWHPHGHILIVLKGDPAAAFSQVNGLRAGWLASLAGAGLHGGKAAWQLQDASRAGDYIAKWGAGEELALHGAKSGRNGARTPFAILADARDGCRASSALFAEYAAAMVGKRQLVWSNGLKALFGIGDTSDADAAQEAEPSDVPSLETLRTWAIASWREARRRRVSIVHAAQSGGCLDAAERGPTDAELWRRDLAESALLDPD